MSDALKIDFLLVPWSKSRASWRCTGAAVLDTIQATLKGHGERLVVLCPASSNPHLAGVVEIDSTSFRAAITATGRAPSPPVPPEALAQMNAGKFTVLLHGLGLTYTSPASHELTVTLEAAHHEKAENRMDYLLASLWDLRTWPSAC